jgi:hypothetical protein
MRIHTQRRSALPRSCSWWSAFSSSDGVSLGGQATQAKNPSATDIGAVGIDLDCPAVTCPDFGIDQQLHKAATAGKDRRVQRSRNVRVSALLPDT